MDQRRASHAIARTISVLFLTLVLAFTVSVSAQAASSDTTASSTGGSDRTVSLDKLADLLENDKTRDQLINELRQAAPADQTSSDTAANDQGASDQSDAKADKSAQNNVDAADGAAAAPAEKPAAKPSAPANGKKAAAGPAKPRMSFARQFAHKTSEWSEMISGQVLTAWHKITAMAKSNGPAKRRAAFNTKVFLHAAMIFALVVGATIVSFLVLRFLASFLFAPINRFASHSEKGAGMLVRRGTAILIAILVDVGVVALAGGAGYMAGLFAIGDAGTIGTRETLFINAFVIIELVKVVIRALFASRYDSLRLLNISTEVAAWWSIRLRWFVGIIGYALLVAVPIVNEQISFMAGTALIFVVMGLSYLYALKVIFGNRKLITARLKQRADDTSVGFFSVLYRIAARLWVLLAVAYFTVLFVASQLDPQGALPFMLSATVQTILAAAIGFGLSGLLSKAIGRRVNFSDSVRQRLPMLEARVNSYVPNALKVIRVVILVVVAAVIANAWRLFNLDEWLGSDAGLTTISVAVKVMIILASAALLWLVAASIIEHRLSGAGSRGAPSARQQTLLGLFRNALAILIAAFTIMITLSQIGVDIGPLIAGAGVFGLAIGFGAQKLVQDIITGVFIQLENAMNTGDVVTVGGITGTAERLTIRSVSIRDIDGCYHIVPFSSASVVSNYMRDWAYFRTEYGIAYREDIDNAIYHLREAFEDLKSDPTHGPNIIENIAVPGVTALGDSSVNIRVMIKTTPGTQWGIGRAFNRLVKIHFDRAGIELPFPHRTLYFGEDRDGNAPAAPIRVLDHDNAEAPQKLKKRRRGDDAAPDETGDAPGDT